MKLTRCTNLSFVAAGLILALCLCAACIFGPPAPEQNNTAQNETPVNVGIVPLTEYKNSHESFTLKDAASAVTGYYQYQANASSQTPSFYYIEGHNVGTSGKAEIWTFGIREGNSTSVLVYDRTGVARIPLQGNELPMKEINIPNILSPDSIIKIAFPDNQNITGNLELEISDEEYTLTAPSGSHPREYRINATTGVLIATHD